MALANGTGQQRAALGHIPAIDILRGLAILWVVLFHLWEDIKIFPDVPIDYFSAFGRHVIHGEIASVPTSLIDAVLRIGYQGVPVFMMLSGLSLYLSATLRPERYQLVRFLSIRFRRVLLPYWFGFALMLASIVVLAAVQALIFGTSFGYEYHNGITIAEVIAVDINLETALASIAIIPRMLRDEWLYIPNGSLWFVILMVQYYVMFPLLKIVIDRFGPVALVAGALALTIAGKLTLIAIVGNIADSPALRLNSTIAPFRMFEFALGMGVGYLLVHRRELLDEYLSAPLDIANVVVIGLLLQIGGSSFDARTGYLAALSLPMTIAGLTLLALPLIAKTPGRVEASAPMRLIAWIGVMSYAVLITNEPLRLVASTLQVHDAPDGWWWFFLVVVYMPATVLLARPVAVLLGLAPGRDAPPRESVPPAAEAQQPSPAASP